MKKLFLTIPFSFFLFACSNGSGNPSSPDESVTISSSSDSALSSSVLVESSSSVEPAKKAGAYMATRRTKYLGEDLDYDYTFEYSKIKSSREYVATQHTLKYLHGGISNNVLEEYTVTLDGYHVKNLRYEDEYDIVFCPGDGMKLGYAKLEQCPEMKAEPLEDGSTRYTTVWTDETVPSSGIVDKDGFLILYETGAFRQEWVDPLNIWGFAKVSYCTISGYDGVMENSCEKAEILENSNGKLVIKTHSSKDSEEDYTIYEFAYYEFE